MRGGGDKREGRREGEEREERGRGREGQKNKNKMRSVRGVGRHMIKGTST